MASFFSLFFIHALPRKLHHITWNRLLFSIIVCHVLIRGSRGISNALCLRSVEVVQHRSRTGPDDDYWCEYHDNDRSVAEFSVWKCNVTDLIHLAIHIILSLSFLIYSSFSYLNSLDSNKSKPPQRLRFRKRPLIALLLLMPVSQNHITKWIKTDKTE